MGGCLKISMILAVVGLIGLLLLGIVGGVVYMNWEKLGLPPMEELKRDFDQGFSQGMERARDRRATQAEKGSGETTKEFRRPIAGRAPMHVNKVSYESAMKRSDVLVLVDYYADWCGPCKRLAPSLAKLAQKHGDKVIVLKVNVDKEGELAQKAGVSSIPDVRLLHGGKQLDRFVGLVSYEKIEALILKNESRLPPPREVPTLPGNTGVGSIDPVTKKYLPPGMSRK